MAVGPFFVVALPCWGFAAALLWYGIGTYQRDRDAVDTTCTVVESVVKRASDPTDGSTTGSFAAVTIAHELDGKRYEGHDSGGHDAAESESRTKLSLFPVGAHVPCKYSRDEPEDVWVFEKGSSDLLRSGIAAGMLFALPLILVLYWRRRGDGV
jgi:hypothetical protein